MRKGLYSCLDSGCAVTWGCRQWYSEGWSSLPCPASIWEAAPNPHQRSPLVSPGLVQIPVSMYQTVVTSLAQGNGPVQVAMAPVTTRISDSAVTMDGQAVEVVTLEQWHAAISWHRFLVYFKIFYTFAEVQSNEIKSLDFGRKVLLTFFLKRKKGSGFWNCIFLKHHSWFSGIGGTRYCVVNFTVPKKPNCGKDFFLRKRVYSSVCVCVSVNICICVHMDIRIYIYI